MFASKNAVSHAFTTDAECLRGNSALFFGKMVTQDLPAKQANSDSPDESLAIAFGRPAAACKFALMPTQLLVESADPILLLSDTVCKNFAHAMCTFSCLARAC